MIALIEDTQRQRMVNILIESQDKVRKNKQRLQVVNAALHKERINLFLANVKISSQKVSDHLMHSLALEVI